MQKHILFTKKWNIAVRENSHIKQKNPEVSGWYLLMNKNAFFKAFKVLTSLRELSFSLVLCVCMSADEWVMLSL